MEVQGSFHVPSPCLALNACPVLRGTARTDEGPTEAAGTGWTLLPQETERAAETEIYDGRGLHDLMVRR